MKRISGGKRDPRNVLIVFLLLITAVSVSMTVVMMRRSPEPLDFAPVETDPAAERYDDDTKPASDDSDTLSIMYSGEVNVSLGEGLMTFLVGNPASSECDVVLQIEVTDGENPAVIGRTGRIPVGMKITKTRLITENITLTPGAYEGQIRVIGYAAATGSRTQFDSLLTDISIVVTE